MSTDLKRFTISITPQMEADLDSLKQRLYYRETRNTMIRDLIVRGLATLETEEAAEEENRNVCPEIPTQKTYAGKGETK